MFILDTIFFLCIIIQMYDKIAEKLKVHTVPLVIFKTLVYIFLIIIFGAVIVWMIFHVDISPIVSKYWIVYPFVSILVILDLFEKKR